VKHSSSDNTSLASGAIKKTGHARKGRTEKTKEQTSNGQSGFATANNSINTETERQIRVNKAED